MFSPYYAWSRRHAGAEGADPLNHCALNVALYGSARGRWAMTERGRRQVHRDAHALAIGPSALEWIGDALRIEIDEVTVPWPHRLRGTVTLHPLHRYDHPYELAPRHRWCPIAPTARVDVALDGQRWSGRGYLDANQGDEPPGRAFRRWDWARAHTAGDHGVVLYDVERIDTGPMQLGLRFDAKGHIDTIDETDVPPAMPLPRSGWGIERIARSESDTPARVRRTLTDAPFYARSILSAKWLGEHVAAMHESLSLARLERPWVQAMLPFRMPRRSG